MAVSDRRTLLEHLASAGWFAQNGEVALTSSLEFCLNRDRVLSNAFHSMVLRRAGVDTTRAGPDWWQAEYVDAERRRPDLVGWRRGESGDEAVVFVEAKVGAEFGRRQVPDYLDTQRSLLRAAGVDHGILIVLVPANRTNAIGAEIDRQLADRCATSDGDTWIIGSQPEIRLIVASWGEVLDVLEAASEHSADDIRQLAGACRALRATDVLAVNSDDLAGGWRNRIDSLLVLVDQVTRDVTEELIAQGRPIRLNPTQPKPSDGLLGGFRYVGESGQPNLAVGLPQGDVRSSQMRASGDDPPLWVRWHRATTDARAVKSRLAQSGIEALQDPSGLLWYPLELDSDDGIATRQRAALVRQVVNLYVAGLSTGGGGHSATPLPR